MLTRDILVTKYKIATVSSWFVHNGCDCSYRTLQYNVLFSLLPYILPLYAATACKHTQLPELDAITWAKLLKWSHVYLGVGSWHASSVTWSRYFRNRNAAFCLKESNPLPCTFYFNIFLLKKPAARPCFSLFQPPARASLEIRLESSFMYLMDSRCIPDLCTNSEEQFILGALCHTKDIQYFHLGDTLAPMTLSGVSSQRSVSRQLCHFLPRWPQDSARKLDTISPVLALWYWRSSHYVNLHDRISLFGTHGVSQNRSANFAWSGSSAISRLDETEFGSKITTSYFPPYDLG